MVGTASPPLDFRSAPPIRCCAGNVMLSACLFLYQQNISRGMCVGACACVCICVCTWAQVCMPCTPQGEESRVCTVTFRASPQRVLCPPFQILCQLLAAFLLATLFTSCSAISIFCQCHLLLMDKGKETCPEAAPVRCRDMTDPEGARI